MTLRCPIITLLYSSFWNTSVMETRTEVISNEIKLCPRWAQTCVLLLFCDRDFDINTLTLKLKGDLDILKMNLHTENEAATLTDGPPSRRPHLFWITGIGWKLRAGIQKNIKYVSKTKVKVEMSKALNYFQHYHNIYSDQASAFNNLRPVVFELHATAFSLVWPWPGNHDLENEPWPRYFEDVSPNWKWSCYQAIQ